EGSEDEYEEAGEDDDVVELGEGEALEAEAGEVEEAAPPEVQRTNGKMVPMDANWAGLRHEAVELVQRSRTLLDRMHPEDRAEAVTLQEAIESAVAHHDPHALDEAVRSLKELLFFVESA